MELDFKKKIIIGLFFTVIILISIYLYYDYVNNNSNDIITFNIYASEGMDENAVADAVIDRLGSRYVRRGMAYG